MPTRIGAAEAAAAMEKSDQTPFMAAAYLDGTLVGDQYVHRRLDPSASCWR